MDLAAILAPKVAERATRTLAMLRQHRAEPMALTGGLALELHMLHAGRIAGSRALNDIDFVVDSFAEIPATLNTDLLFRHVHPHDPPGKTLLQCVYPETAVRVDIFRAYGQTMARAVPVVLAGSGMRMADLGDLAARTARLCMGLAAGEPVPAKHVRDMLRLLDLPNIEHVEVAWLDHRKPGYPNSFAEATGLLRELIDDRPDLQIVQEYSRDTSSRCSRCEQTAAFPLADSVHILRLLGYC